MDIFKTRYNIRAFFLKYNIGDIFKTFLYYNGAQRINE